MISAMQKSHANEMNRKESMLFVLNMYVLA